MDLIMKFNFMTDIMFLKMSPSQVGRFTDSISCPSNIKTILCSVEVMKGSRMGGEDIPLSSVSYIMFDDSSVYEYSANNGAGFGRNKPLFDVWTERSTWVSYSQLSLPVMDEATFERYKRIAKRLGDSFKCIKKLH